MSDFWVAFWAGLASGVAIAVITALVRRLLRKQPDGKPLRPMIKGLRPLLVVVIGFALIFIDIFMVKDGGFLRGIGALLLIWSSMDFLA